MAPSSIAHQSNEDHTHSSMMAWRVHEFGPPDVMRFERILRPYPSPGEVLVKVKAAGVGPWDGWIRAGKSALPQPLPLTLGSDLSGEVVAVQSGDLRVGDQVYGGFSGIGKGTARARSALIEQFQAWRRNNAGRLAPTGKAVSSGLYLLLVEDRA